MKMGKLSIAVLVIVGTYVGFEVVFTYILKEPIPASVMKMYMFFIVVGVLAVITSSEESVSEISGTINSFIYDPCKRTTRNVVFMILPFLAMWTTYYMSESAMNAPVELRTVHPAPPPYVNVYGKTVNLQTVKNPYRHLEKENPDKFRQAVMQGRDVYFENCVLCHGGKLEGKGHYAVAFNNPLPSNFTDAGTIAQLPESFLFWRIATGGKGLPNEGAPWASPMPAWENFLTEDEIWKVICFLYDYTGHAPQGMAEGH